MSAIINHEHILWSACDKRNIISSTGENRYLSCTEAFLFSMVNPHGYEPTRIPLTRQGQGNSISCRADLGPTFGGEFCGQHALSISDHANISYSESNDIYNVYKFPPERDTFFTGSSRFDVTDYEVFSLNWSKTNELGEEGGVPSKMGMLCPNAWKRNNKREAIS